MSAETALKPAGALFNRLISRPRPAWVTAIIGLLLVLLPPGAAWLDGTIAEFFDGDTWRVSLTAPAVIVYVLIVSPLLGRMQAGVVAAFRSLVLVDEESFDRLVSQAARLNPVGEIVAFLVGVILGVIGQDWTFGEDRSWLGLCVAVLLSLMLGLLAWTIYAVLGNRLIRTLHRQPLRIDIFDPQPFEAVGRQSLSMALVFVGGITLATLLSLGRLDPQAWGNWLVYLVLILVPLLIFFLNMRDTHRLLAAEKEREMAVVERLILKGSRTLMQRVAAEENTGTLAAELNGLVAYEARLRAARTWPYDTAMLRTLFFSMILPAAMAVAQIFITKLLE